MLAEENKAIQEASAHLHILTEDEKIRLQCEGRERYEFDMASARNGGFRRGKKEAQAEINQLNEHLLVEGRLDDLRRSVKDPAYQKQLMQEYGIISAGA